ncbi:MAG TPA: hypothetical protein VK850_19385 [Candidatus Binatia bacterium]|nr:hypothetical protein [Candidatus Binatia bacterium]
MRAKLCLFLAAGLQVAWLTGCYPAVDGRHSMGMPFVKDTIEARYERPPMEIWKSAKEVIAFNGQLVSEDVLKNTLEGSVNTRKVWIRVEPLDDRVTRVLVEARTKSGGADLEMAGELDKQIALRLQANGSSPLARPATAMGRP